MPVLVEALRYLHRAVGGEAELARRLLLQGRGRERRRRVALDRLRLDRGHLVGAGFQRRLDVAGHGLVRNIQAAELVAVEAGDAGDEAAAVRRLQRHRDRPVFARLENFDLVFAVADQPQRYRLDAAGRTRAGELPPENRGEREADEVVQRPAGEVGVDQRRIDAPRVLHRFQHRVLGHGVEDHALDRLVVDDLLLPQHLQDVPRNRFALAVRVGREDQAVGIFHRARDFGEALLRLAVHLPQHGEIVFRVDRAVLGGQVADVAIGGQHLIAGAQVLIDGFGLGGGLDDNEVHLCRGLGARSSRRIGRCSNPLKSLRLAGFPGAFRGGGGPRRSGGTIQKTTRAVNRAVRPSVPLGGIRSRIHRASDGAPGADYQAGPCERGDGNSPCLPYFR